MASSLNVAPRAGAWIETPFASAPDTKPSVAPRAGAWIETFALNNGKRLARVAPRAGAWIETPVRRLFKLLLSVAPHAGALVEVQIAIQCWGVCIGVALAVGYETTADGAQLHPPLLCCA